MKKVFIIHGFEGSPNGGWRPWLMRELEKIDIYAVALSMKNPNSPKEKEWSEEILNKIKDNKKDEIFLVGHSLGVPAILRVLEKTKIKIKGAILVSGPEKVHENKKISDFYKKSFNYKKIKKFCEKFVIIHGDNDPLVPIDDARILSKNLNGELVIIKNGRHLNGGAGFTELPQALNALTKMFK